MAKPETVSEVLNAAADLLMRTGWCQGGTAKNRHGQTVSYWRTDAARFCAWGAIARSVSDSNVECLDRAFAADAALADHVGTNSVAVWNDARCTRRAQVVKAMREVANAEGTHQ